jgi:hypothetical protein
MKMTRVQRALKILKASAEEIRIEDKPRARKSAVPKKSKPAAKKSSK